MYFQPVRSSYFTNMNGFITVWVVRLLIISQYYLVQLLLKLCRVRCLFILTSDDLLRSSLRYLFQIQSCVNEVVDLFCINVYSNVILRTENKDYGRGLGLMINFSLSCLFLIIHRTVEGTTDILNTNVRKQTPDAASN